jgi:hypothetical protein
VIQITGQKITTIAFLKRREAAAKLNWAHNCLEDTNIPPCVKAGVPGNLPGIERGDGSASCALVEVS